MNVKRYFSLLIVLVFLTSCKNPDWRNASREPAGIALSPVTQKQAVIEFYAADAFSWRGIFAVHSWLAIKPENAAKYTVYEVVGWRVRSGLPALKSYETTTPDRYWYGAKPEKFFELSGEQANKLIPKIKDAISQYPWANEYTVFPGPNSNTFPAWVALKVPELNVSMPLRAIGSGYADNDEQLN